MPKLPRLNRRLDPGLGNAGYLAPRNRPAPVGDVASGVGRLASGLDAYQQAAARIQVREDTISRKTAESDFEEAANELYRGQLTVGGFGGREDVQNFRTALDELVNTSLGGYQGGAESRAMLAEKLTGRRGELIGQAAGAAVVEQRTRIRDGFNRQVSSISAGLLQDPGNLPDAWADLDAAIDDVAMALAPEEETELRAIARARTAGAAVESFLMYGDTDGALQTLALPGVAESLPPEQQTAFARQITLMRRDEDQRRNERRQRYENAAAALGTTVDQLPLWARLQLEGLQLPATPPPYDAQSPAGKLVQDRQVFMEQYGEDSPQVRAFDDLAQREARGEPPSLSDVGSMRGQFLTQAKSFVTAREAFGRVQAAAQERTPAGDHAVIFNYAKILDPQSVVRESEFQTIARQGGWGQKIMSWITMADAGLLDDTVRNDIVNQSRAQMRVQLDAHRELETEYRGIAERAGINPRDVVVDLVAGLDPRPRLTDDADPAAGGSAPPSAAAPGSSLDDVFDYGLDGTPVRAGGG